MTPSLRLRTLMRRRGIRSQSQLARISGVAQSSIHRILAGLPGYVPTHATLSRLAVALDSTPSWLSDGVVAIDPRSSDSRRDAGFDTWCGLYPCLAPDQQDAMISLARTMAMACASHEDASATAAGDARPPPAQVPAPCPGAKSKA